MASVAGISTDAGRGAGSSLTDFVDRWIFVFTAAFFIVTVLVGFVPDSIAKVAAVEAGRRPPFPVVLHVHAVLMGTWLTLLLTQTILMATGRRKWHMQLGVVSLVLAPAMVVTGLVLVPTMYGMLWPVVQAAPPQAKPAMELALRNANNIALLQIRVGVLFPLFIGMALAARRKDPQFHKRLIILATSMPLGAAVQRMTWLPSSLPESGLSPVLLGLIPVVPMFVWDVYRLGRVPRAYTVWFAICAPTVVVGELLWDSKWWLATVPKMMGVAG